MSAASSYGICSTFLQGHGAHVPVRGRGSELLLLKRALWEDELGDVQEPMLERLPQRRAAVSSDEEEKRRRASAATHLTRMTMLFMQGRPP